MCGSRVCAIGGVVDIATLVCGNRHGLRLSEGATVRSNDRLSDGYSSCGSIEHDGSHVETAIAGTRIRHIDGQPIVSTDRPLRAGRSYGHEFHAASLPLTNSRSEFHLVDDGCVLYITGNSQLEAVDGDLVATYTKVVEDHAIDGTAHRSLSRDGTIHMVEFLAADAPAVCCLGIHLLIAGSIPYHAVVFVIEVLGVIRVVCTFSRYSPQRVERLIVSPYITTCEKEEHGEQVK